MSKMKDRLHMNELYPPAGDAKETPARTAAGVGGPGL